MSATKVRLVLLVGGAAAALAWGDVGRAGDGACSARIEDAPEPQPFMQGASACELCHRAGKPPPEEGGLLPLCRCTELTFWKNNDKHQDAFDALTRKRGHDINDRRKAGSPEMDADCLGCHSMYSVPRQSHVDLGDKVLSEGVSCIACHGAYKDWVFPHGSTILKDRQDWRARTRTEKEARFGMKDLWDPVKRTEVCASCHIGDPDPDKHRFVTHEMYAAGHPPLPAFETAVFCNSLPRHWQLMNEKEPQVQHDQKWNPRELEQTKLAVVGQAAAFRQTMNLLTAQAERTPENEALDFALFDCSSCHHDLKQPSWRQTAGYEGPPGRPRVRRWSPAGLDLCLWCADGTEDGRKMLRDAFDAKMGDLRAAFTSRPYGDAGKVRDAGKALVQWADAELLPRLVSPGQGDDAKTRYDAKAALALLKRLAHDAANPARGKTPDYDGARQTAWTFRAVYEDVTRALKESKNDPEAVKAWQALQDKQAAIQGQLDKLETALNLTLPNAKGISDEDYAKDPNGAKSQRQGEVEVFLPLVLKHKADYEPQEVRDAFAELANLLP